MNPCLQGNIVSKNIFDSKTFVLTFMCFVLQNFTSFKILKLFNSTVLHSCFSAFFANNTVLKSIT